MQSQQDIGQYDQMLTPRHDDMEQVDEQDEQDMNNQFDGQQNMNNPNENNEATNQQQNY